MSDLVSNSDDLKDLREFEKEEADRIQVEEFVIDVEEIETDTEELKMDWY